MSQKFSFKKLDARTRSLMAEEISSAREKGQLYYSTRFTQVGANSWPAWLLDAGREYDEHWLAFQIKATNAMKHLETRAKPKGGFTVPHVPDTAAETFAEGQFNRFYIAAICRRAIEDGTGSVHVYRAQQSNNPRAESVALEGTTRNAATLLAEVRSKDMSLNCDLLKPNSGLSIDF